MKSDQPPSVFEVATVALKTADNVATTVETVAETTQQEFERTWAPVRASFSKRYPILFFSTVLVGVTATVLGIEHVLLEYQLLQDYPWLILGLGLTLLIITGTLFKKLG